MVLKSEAAIKLRKGKVSEWVFKMIGSLEAKQNRSIFDRGPLSFIAFRTKMIEGDLRTRPAVSAEQQQIADLVLFQQQIHRHLDWHAPLEWLGRQPYFVLEKDGRIAADWPARLTRLPYFGSAFLFLIRIFPDLPPVAVMGCDAAPTGSSPQCDRGGHCHAALVRIHPDRKRICFQSTYCDA